MNLPRRFGMKIEFNKALVWDYDITPEDLKKEEVFILYLSRVLNNGSFEDVQQVPPEIIKKYLEKLHLSSKVSKFWLWYLKEEKNGQHHF